VLTLALSNGALLVLHGIDATPPRALELAVLVLGSLLATVTRFVALKTWVFARGQRPRRPSTVSARNASSTAAAAAGVSGRRSSSTASSAE